MSQLARVDFPDDDGPVRRIVGDVAVGVVVISSMVRSQSSGISSGTKARDNGSADDSAI